MALHLAHRLAQPWPEIRSDHPLQLVRHARENPDVFAANLNVKSRRSATLVRERRLTSKHVRLSLVDLRHLPAAGGEAFLDAIDDRLIEHHLQAECLHERLAGEIVVGGSEAAGKEKDVGAVEDVAYFIHELFETIADDALANDFDAVVLERGGDLQRVRVPSRRPEHLRANGDDGRLHATRMLTWQDCLSSMKVVIIGAGVIGCSIAYHLASRGVRNVRVVDRAGDFGAGSTPRATGGFRSQFGTEVNVRLSMLSREKLLRFEDEIGVDSGYRQYGYLFMARTPNELDELLTAQKVQHACGVKEARTIDADEIRRLNPAVRDESLIGGTFCPTDGFIVANQIMRGYAEAATRLGAKFEFETTVRSFDRGVTYVNAAGAWAAEVSDVPVTPLRRRAACTVPTNVLPADMPMTIWAGDAFHVRVRNGRVMLVWPDTPPNDDIWLDTVLRWA